MVIWEETAVAPPKRFADRRAEALARVWFELAVLCEVFYLLATRR